MHVGCGGSPLHTPRERRAVRRRERRVWAGKRCARALTARCQNSRKRMEWLLAWRHRHVHCRGNVRRHSRWVRTGPRRVHVGKLGCPHVSDPAIISGVHTAQRSKRRTGTAGGRDQAVDRAPEHGGLPQGGHNAGPPGRGRPGTADGASVVERRRDSGRPATDSPRGVPPRRSATDRVGGRGLGVASLYAVATAEPRLACVGRSGKRDADRGRRG
mmetsp:Transcript_37444/g.98204  ORF Transcript_37444/g.98204 Transcript_37444/m.98204 type:complete len:215 (-) Transcript_37444:117-761(-)